MEWGPVGYIMEYVLRDGNLFLDGQNADARAVPQRDVRETVRGVRGCYGAGGFIGV